VFDVSADTKIWEEGQLKAVLECNHVVKVFHDCRNISSVLNVQLDINLCNVFDAQAAHAVLEMQENGKPIHKVKNESLNALCDLYGASVNPIKDQLKAVYRKDPRFWARRPLSAEMVIYAASDVLCLVPEIYLAMKRAIKPEFANLFKELCDEQIMANIDSETVKSKKKQRKLDFEVSELRLKIATTHKNIVLSNREIRLLRHVDLTDEDKERLRGSYKVAKKLEKLEGGNKPKDSDDEDSDNNNDLELPSLESINSDVSEKVPPRISGGLFSPTSDCSSDFSQPTSLTDSMAMVNKILANGNLDRLERIEKLEAILTDVTSMALNSRSSSTQHINLSGIATNGSNSNAATTPNKVDAETQTISTGDISFTKVYSPSKNASSPPY
jgi:exonuclease 3'-5' domain-containing protein 1